MATEDDRALNRSATVEGISADSFPHITIGGVVVFVYVRHGVLRVSLHFDEAEPPLLGPGEDACVPVAVSMGGRVVWSADAAGRGTRG